MAADTEQVPTLNLDTLFARAEGDTFLVHFKTLELFKTALIIK